MAEKCFIVVSGAKVPEKLHDEQSAPELLRETTRLVLALRPPPRPPLLVDVIIQVGRALVNLVRAVRGTGRRSVRSRGLPQPPGPEIDVTLLP